MTEDITEYRGYTIEIFQDCESNPREDFDELGTMVCFHNRHNLGDKHKFTTKTIQQLVKRKDVLSLPLYLLDHSGLTMRTKPFQCKWDSGQVGFIFVTKEEVRKEFGVKRVSPNLRAHIVWLLKKEVEMYDHFLTGDIYGFIIKDGSGNPVDACHGYYGYNHEQSGLMGSAKAAIDYCIADKSVKEKHGRS